MLTLRKNRYYQTETIILNESLWQGDYKAVAPGEYPCDMFHFFAVGTGTPEGGLIGGTTNGMTITVKFLWTRTEMINTVTLVNWDAGNLVQAASLVGETDGYLTLEAIDELEEGVRKFTFTVNSNAATPHSDLYFAGFTKYKYFPPACYDNPI